MHGNTCKWCRDCIWFLRRSVRSGFDG